MYYELLSLEQVYFGGGIKYVNRWYLGKSDQGRICN